MPRTLVFGTPCAALQNREPNEDISLEDEVDMVELLSLAMEILKERDKPLEVLGVELDNTLLVTILSLFGTLGGAVISGLMRFLL